MRTKPSLTDNFLRIHEFLPHSRVNGPGIRAVVWVQGCSLGCPGCFNPQTHPFEPGKLVSVDELFGSLLALQGQIEGVTISGGEPLQQRQPLMALLRRVRQESPLSVLLFSGFTWTKIQQMPEAPAFLNYIDVLIAGRYEAEQHLARDLRGSANKSLHFLTNRYTQDNLRAIPAAEVVITPGGEVVLSGIDPLTWLT
jgi:anaerobic ribonucleoside-triphosphate reductase activating protein